MISLCGSCLVCLCVWMCVCWRSCVVFVWGLWVVVWIGSCWSMWLLMWMLGLVCWFLLWLLWCCVVWFGSLWWCFWSMGWVVGLWVLDFLYMCWWFFVGSVCGWCSLCGRFLWLFWDWGFSCIFLMLCVVVWSFVCMRLFCLDIVCGVLFWWM